jgi:hypothetical protein
LRAELAFLVSLATLSGYPISPWLGWSTAAGFGLAALCYGVYAAGVRRGERDAA